MESRLSYTGESLQLWLFTAAQHNLAYKRGLLRVGQAMYNQKNKLLNYI